MSTLNYKLFYQRDLPHYQPPGATLFVTFRLAGSLPREVLASLETEKRRLEIKIRQIQAGDSRREAIETAQETLFNRWDRSLDAVLSGPQWLMQPEIARLVADAIQYRDGKQYRLDACCLMPNHVHLVCTPLEQEGEYYSLARIMHSLKGYTAREANRLLARSGGFWQHESYDHVVRDETEFQRIVDYVVQNPVLAGLKPDWVFNRWGHVG